MPASTRTTAQQLGCALFLFVLGSSLGLPLHGQARGDQTPLWWAITVGAGGTRLTCDICQPARDMGPSAEVSVGAYGANNLRVGIEAGGWTHDDAGTRETVYRAGVVAHLSPVAGRGLYLVGGFGWSGYRAEEFRLDAPRFSAGTGWDLPLVAGWLIGSQIVLDAASLGSLKNQDLTVTRGVGLSTVRFSIHLRRI